MLQTQIIATLTELQELRRMQEELTAEIETLQSAIRAHMEDNAPETLSAGLWRVSYKTVTSTRIDTAALRRALSEAAERFSKTITTRRLTVH